jgi:hypothetical protein
MLTFPKTTNDDDTPIILQDYFGPDFEMRSTLQLKSTTPPSNWQERFSKVIASQNRKFKSVHGGS